VEEGADPRDAALVAFGGAGGLHASRLARRLGMRTVLIPPRAGVLSALGLLLAAPRADAARSVLMAEGAGEPSVAAAALESEAVQRYRATFGGHPAERSASADVRYRGQAHELSVGLTGGWPELRAAFEAAHRDHFGFARPAEPIELVTVRAVAAGEPPVRWTDLPAPHEGHATGGDVPAGQVRASSRAGLPPGATLEGPATIVEADATIALEAGDHLTVLADGTLEIVP
jgi:N-methylhydantoinase A